MQVGNKSRDDLYLCRRRSWTLICGSTLIMEFGMEEWGNKRNGDVELVSSFPTQFESPKTESGCKSYGQNGVLKFLSNWQGRRLRPCYPGDSGLSSLIAETPAWGRRLRPGRSRTSRTRPRRDLGGKSEPKQQIGGGNNGIRLWERKGS